MIWSLTEDVEEFLATAGAFLRSRAAEHSILLSVSDLLQTGGRTAAARFGWWAGPDGSVGAVFLRTPPHPVLMGHASTEAAGALAGALFPLDPELPGVNATPENAAAFAAQWRRHTGTDAEVHRRVRLYRLGTLTPPATPGGVRTAGPADRDLLLGWYTAFGEEIGENLSDVPEMVDDVISYGGVSLWQVDGVPVSMAAATRAVAGVVRVAPVYTPPASRQRGYGGAVTAAVSRAALDAGATDVVLYTDLANPTSNSIYQRLGYRPVHDRVVLAFTAAA
jgi:GNAT superfamily N-acetyltransferase